MTEAREGLQTHEVWNQPAVPGPRDPWATDAVLREAVTREGGRAEVLAGYGAVLGSEAMAVAAREAERVSPEPVLFDRGGRRLDEVRYVSGYHELMSAGIGAGYAALAWEGGAGGHVSHAAMVYMASQLEPGHCCPMTMTYAAVPALAGQGGVPEAWRQKLLSRIYDPAVAPLGDKAGATLGMAMTETQGGSDVRANTTRAERDGADWRLTGHKWFCSAPMSDGFLTLAQAPGGLSCFLVPRWLDGARNGVQIQRLKDKLGNRANASSEIEYQGALAYPVGAEGNGIRTILEMVHHTRLDTAMAPAGLMRAALAEAWHWAEGRRVFQKRLVDQPLMRAVLADLALDWEAATALGLRVARAFDAGAGDARERALARIGVALAKFHNNKRAPVVIYEAMEVLGGMGYVNDTPLPMLYREAPLNGIWEGSGNVICLDILRTLARVPEAGEALRAELEAARGISSVFDAALDAHVARWPGVPEEAEARLFAERLAVLFAGSLLLRFVPGEVGATYAATRLGGEAGRISGAIPSGEVDVILARLSGRG